MSRSRGGGATKGKRKRGATKAGGSAGGGPQPASPPFDYKQAMALYNTDKGEECVALCREGVQAGDAKAQCLLGQCYLYGRGVDEDDEEAARLFRLSAAQNEPLGVWMLGLCHQHGWGGVEQNDAKAVAQYRLSAAHGCAEGQDALAYMYDSGNGGDADEAEATRLWQMAAQQGDGAAMSRLGDKSTDQAEQLQWHFKAATAAPHQIHEEYREESIGSCAVAARILTTDDDPNGEFVAAIKSIADEAADAVRAETSQTTHVMAMLNQQRLEHGPTPAPVEHASSYACDVTLKAADDTLLPCHRNVLAASSEYFQTLFDSAFDDSKAAVANLPDCTAELAERLLAYVYTGAIEFGSVQDACAVMERAQFFQINTLIKACAVYIKPRTGACNSMLVEAVAVGQECKELGGVARKCTVKNFALATTGDLFLDCSLHTLKATLADEAVHAASEDAVLEAVLRWVAHDQANRAAHLEALLNSIKLAKITTACFQYAIASPMVAANHAVLLKLSSGFAAKAEGAYSPVDGGRASKRPRVS